VLSVATVVFASGAVAILLWSPRALMLALGAGLLALVSRSLFVRVRDTLRAQAMGRAATRGAEAATTVSGAGLVIAAIVIAPLLAFALLWTFLLVLIGGTWLLHAVGLA
jgi:hypothetical protein